MENKFVEPEFLQKELKNVDSDIVYSLKNFYLRNIEKCEKITRLQSKINDSEQKLKKIELKIKNLETRIFDSEYVDISY